MDCSNKTVLLGVSGSIAAYKMANLASMLVKTGARVQVIMTENATKFIHPITFETLTKNKCHVNTFDRNFQFHVAHVSLAQQADVFLLAPATANCIGKIANGIADDMLTTTAMAIHCPKFIAPVMNTHMLTNTIVQENIEKCKAHGYQVIEPDTGRLACGTTGAGKMPSEEELFSYLERALYTKKDLSHKKILITAGPTRELIDPVRFITNHSTGKMGYALAKAAMLRGGEVTLISGPVAIKPPPFVHVIPVVSAHEMAERVLEESEQMSLVIKAAAVADYTIEKIATEKIKKQNVHLSLPLIPTTDILKTLGERKRPGQFLCGFSMETENMIENSKKKLIKKQVDMIVANNLKEEGAGFGGETNRITMMTKDQVKELELMSKEETAHKILDHILEKWC